MLSSAPRIARPDLADGLQKLMLLRVLFVTLLLGASLFIQIRETRTPFGDIQTSHYLLIAGIYFLTVLYAVLYRTWSNLYALAHLQILFDTLFVTALIYTTGGIESFFSFLYLLAVFAGSMLLFRDGGFLAASYASVFYGLLVDLHYYGIIHPIGAREAHGTRYDGIEALYLICVHVAALYIVAYLSGYLAEQLHRSRAELQVKQQDLDRLEVLHQSIIDSIPSGLVALDEQERITFFNPAATSILGSAVEETLGRPFAAVFPEIHQRVRPLLGPAMDQGVETPPMLDFPHPRPGREPLALRVAAAGLKTPAGERTGRILIFQDMTRIKRIEEDMQKMEGLALVGELSAAVAHEIRNPMASISGSLQLLRDDLEEDAVSGRLIDIISREIDRLDHLVKDFQLFARPKKTAPRPVDLPVLLQDSLALIRNSRPHSAGIEIRTDLQADLSLESDPQLLKQVFWNLLLNAFQAMPDGGRLQVSAADHRGSPAGVRIVIRDTGQGFEKGVLKKIFTPFFTTKEEGSGLGLAIVRSIVETLGGTVQGENHPAGGALITVLLPKSPPP